MCRTQHTALVGGPNAVNCPQCQKLFMNGEQLMEHMKFTHRDPNASGVAGIYSTIQFCCLCDFTKFMLNLNMFCGRFLCSHVWFYFSCILSSNYVLLLIFVQSCVILLYFCSNVQLHYVLLSFFVQSRVILLQFMCFFLVKFLKY